MSLSTYLSITWPSCDVSGRIDLIFGLLVGRWHPYSVTPKFWHCCESLSRKVKNHGQKGPKLRDSLIWALSSPGQVVYWNVAFFLRALPYVQLNNKIRMAMVSSWASNGQKGEKLSLFDHLCPRVTFNVPLYNMTQLWREWSHWFDFWFVCRPLAPVFSDAKILALLWIVSSQSEESRAKRPITSR